MDLKFNITNIFYYDYILYAIIEMYNNHKTSDEIIPYLQIASIFSVNFDLKRIILDEEAYIKTIYIKLFQYCLKGTRECIDDVKNAILNVSDKYKQIIDDERLKIIKNYIFICYKYIYRITFKYTDLNNISENELWFKDQLIVNKDLICIDKFLRLKIIEKLRNIKFKKPAIFIFSNEKYIKIKKEL